MKRKRENLLIIIIILLCIFFILFIYSHITLNYVEINGTEKIEKDEFWHQKIEINVLMGEVEEINYNFKVLNGSNIDCLLVSEKDYRKYIASENEIDYIEPFTHYNVAKITGSPYLPKGTFWYIIRLTNNSNGESTFSYQIIYNKGYIAHLFSITTCFFATPIIVVNTILLILIIKPKLKKKVYNPLKNDNKIEQKTKRL